MNTSINSKSRGGSRGVKSKTGRYIIPSKLGSKKTGASIKTNEILRKLDEFNKIREQIEK